MNCIQPYAPAEDGPEVLPEAGLDLVDRGQDRHAALAEPVAPRSPTRRSARARPGPPRARRPDSEQATWPLAWPPSSAPNSARNASRADAAPGQRRRGERGELRSQRPARRSGRVSAARRRATGPPIERSCDQQRRSPLTPGRVDRHLRDVARAAAQPHASTRAIRAVSRSRARQPGRVGLLRKEAREAAGRGRPERAPDRCGRARPSPSRNSAATNARARRSTRRVVRCGRGRGRTPTGRSSRAGPPCLPEDCRRAAGADRELRGRCPTAAPPGRLSARARCARCAPSLAVRGTSSQRGRDRDERRGGEQNSVARRSGAISAGRGGRAVGAACAHGAMPRAPPAAGRAASPGSSTTPARRTSAGSGCAAVLAAAPPRAVRGRARSPGVTCPRAPPAPARSARAKSRGSMPGGAQAARVVGGEALLDVAAAPLAPGGQLGLAERRALARLAALRLAHDSLRRCRSSRRVEPPLDRVALGDQRGAPRRSARAALLAAVRARRRVAPRRGRAGARARRGCARARAGRSSSRLRLGELEPARPLGGAVELRRRPTARRRGARPPRGRASPERVCLPSSSGSATAAPRATGSDGLGGARVAGSRARAPTAP